MQASGPIPGPGDAAHLRRGVWLPWGRSWWVLRLAPAHSAQRQFHQGLPSTGSGRRKHHFLLITGETLSSNTANRDTVTRDTANARRSAETVETKPAFKTTELIAYIVVALGVLIASAVVDQNQDGQGFGADRAWLYVTILTVGYMVSRGLAKAGSYQRDNDPRD